MSNIDWVLLGERLSAKIEQLGVTQASFADKVGISSQHMSNICSGKNSCSTEVLVSLALESHLTIDYLVGLTDYPYIPDTKKLDKMVDDKFNKLSEAYTSVGMEVPANLKETVKQSIVEKCEVLL